MKETDENTERGGGCSDANCYAIMKFFESGWGRLFDKHFDEVADIHSKRTQRIVKRMRYSSDTILMSKSKRKITKEQQDKMQKSRQSKP